MSHITKKSGNFNDRDCIIKAMQNLGGTLHEGPGRFRYFAGAMESCNEMHFTFPDCQYGIGVDREVGEDGKEKFVIKRDTYNGTIYKVDKAFSKEYAKEKLKKISSIAGVNMSEIEELPDGKLRIRGIASREALRRAKASRRTQSLGNGGIAL